MDDLFAAIGYGKLAPAGGPRAVRSGRGARRGPSAEKRESAVSRVVRKILPFGVPDIVVVGHNDLLASLAKCCNPVPGEKIVGYITRGRGVSVHSESCPNVRNLLYDPESPDRRRVGIGEDGPPTAIELEVVTDDRPGLLADVTQAIAGEGSNIRRIEARVGETQQGYVSVSLETSDVKQLEKILGAHPRRARRARRDPKVQRPEGRGARVGTFLGEGSRATFPLSSVGPRSGPLRVYAAGFFLGPAFVTLPDRMHRVQAEALRARPSTTAWTVLRFTCHLRFVTLWAWLTRWPLIGVFPQN